MFHEAGDTSVEEESQSAGAILEVIIGCELIGHDFTISCITGVGNGMV